MSLSKKKMLESTSRHDSTAPMMHIEANVLSTDIEVDEDGNLIIKSKELAKMVEGFLCSDQGAATQRQAAHLLCCKLSCPSC